VNKTTILGNWTLRRFENQQNILRPVTMKIWKVNLYDGFVYRVTLSIVSRFVGDLSQTGPNAWKIEMTNSRSLEVKKK
jgi:hypothetical protein